MDYTIIYNHMQPNVAYTAKELNVASASMTAMVNRGLVRKVNNSSPIKYMRNENNVFNNIVNILSQFKNVEYFTLYKKEQKLGMMCSLDKKNQKVLDCWGKAYDLNNAVKIQVGTAQMPLE